MPAFVHVPRHKACVRPCALHRWQQAYAFIVPDGVHAASGTLRQVADVGRTLRCSGSITIRSLLVRNLEPLQIRYLTENAHTSGIDASKTKIIRGPEWRKICVYIR